MILNFYEARICSAWPLQYIDFWHHGRLVPPACLALSLPFHTKACEINLLQGNLASVVPCALHIQKGSRGQINTNRSQHFTVLDITVGTEATVLAT
jgi:hypothetical protein